MGNQQLKKEVWRQIEGFEGYYSISNTGRVKSLERYVKTPRGENNLRIVRERILCTTIDKYGYESVRLRKKGKTYPRTIHRLVATAFVDNPENLPCVNHVDENKLNNNFSNLEWCTVHYNNVYNGRQEKINKILRNKDYEKIKRTCLSTGEVTIYSSKRDMYRKTGLSRKEVSKCCKGLRDIYKNSKWEFLSSTTISEESTLK